jgi:hypothetical protein
MEDVLKESIASVLRGITGKGSSSMQVRRKTSTLVINADENVI